MKKTIGIALASIALLASCAKEEYQPETLTNKERMNQLVIQDPLVWNSLVNRLIDTDSLGSTLKSGSTGINYAEYPSKTKYYYALFEDLYPSQGDYDFNDVVLETKLFLANLKGDFMGYTQSKVFNRGGSLKTRIGLMFYSFDGKKTFTRIPNEQITVEGNPLNSEDSYTLDLPNEGTAFTINFKIVKGKETVKYLWINYFLIIETGGQTHEIHSSGFAPANVWKFEIPRREYLTENNLPWGLEIESESFFVPVEKTLILDAYPEFRVWAESNGTTNSSWFRNPDKKKVK